MEFQIFMGFLACAQIVKFKSLRHSKGLSTEKQLDLRFNFPQKKWDFPDTDKESQLTKLWLVTNHTFYKLDLPQYRFVRQKNKFF